MIKELWLSSCFQMSCPTYLIGLKIPSEVVYMLQRSVICYVNAIIAFTEENMLVPIVQNNLFP